MSSIVATARSHDYGVLSVRQAVTAAVAAISPSIDRLIKPGDRVALKPYLNAEGLTCQDGSDRRVSHPAVVTALVELLRDCGAIVSVGDEGSRIFGCEAGSPGREWLYSLKSKYGVTLVSFAKAGATSVPSHVPYPRSYLITNALLDVDAVVSCVNCRPHPRLLLMGAVRNMFNAVVGQCQSRLYRLFKADRDLARVVADVCGIVRPNISLVDMTTVVDAESGALRPIGLILASTDPVATDVVAARVLGLDGEAVWTTIHAAKQGIGCADLDDIELRGDCVEFMSRANTSSQPSTIVSPSESVARVLARAAYLHVSTPRPVVHQSECARCGDCERICPVGAVIAHDDGTYAIRHDQCVNCHLCVESCQHKAIQLDRVGLANVLHQPKRVVKNLWGRAKIGVQMPLGPICMHMKIDRHVKVSRNGAYTARGARAAALQTDNDVLSVNEHREQANGTPARSAQSRQDACLGQVALVIGAGHGLGSAMSRRFALAGMDVAVAARHSDKLKDLVQEICEKGSQARAYGCDAQWEPSVKELFRRVDNDLGIVDLVVFNVEHFVPGGILEIEAPAFEKCWRAMCLGGFLVAKEAAKRMVARKRGTIIYTGATASMRGRAGYINMAVGKFGNRALAQSLARELGPKGIHVAHVVIDGGILSSRSRAGAVERMSSLFPDEIANSVFHLYQQHPSAWSQEIDLRPWVEQF